MHTLEELDDELNCFEAGECVPGVAHLGGSVANGVRGGFGCCDSGAADAC